METPFHKGKVLLLDKPLRWTSFDLVNKVRVSIEKNYGLKKRSLKVGHAGTLDPLATGLMILCTGKMTKNIESFQGLEKEYEGTFFLGATTPSFDLEKEVDQTYSVAHIDEASIWATAKEFIGKHDQLPPVFSAKIVEGKRAYDYARKGEDVVLKTKEIEIKAFEIKRIKLPEVDFRIVCSKGTYIRSIARDFGSALHSGAYLSRLCRTRIGEYSLSQTSDLCEGIPLLKSTQQTNFHDEHVSI